MPDPSGASFRKRISIPATGGKNRSAAAIRPSLLSAENPCVSGASAAVEKFSERSRDGPRTGTILTRLLTSIAALTVIDPGTRR